MQHSQQQRHTVEILWQGKLGKRMEKAAKAGATHVIIIGGDEAKSNSCALKDMKTGDQKIVPLGAFSDKQILAQLLAL